MLEPLLRLRGLTMADIASAVQAALEPGASPDGMAAFVASVDWSGATGDEPVARLLGELEHIATELAEGDVSEAEYREVLERLAGR